MKKQIILGLLAIVAISSCKKELQNKAELNQKNTLTTNVSSMKDIQVPANFNWNMSRDVKVKVSLNDPLFGSKVHKIQLFNEDPAQGGLKIAEGSATLDLAFEAIINTPSSQGFYYMVRTAPDGSKTIEKLSIGGNNSITVTVQPANKISLGKTGSGPDCSTGCTQTITTSNTNLNLNSGDVVCVTGSNITIGFNANGGTVRICGSNVTVQNANLNNSSTLIVTSTGSATFGSLNQNGSGTTFQNYGTSTISGSFSPGGSVTNEGTLSTSGDFNLNSGATVTNNSTINVSQTVNVNGSTTLTNNGSITVNSDFHINGNGQFINNCKLWVKNNFDANSMMKNYSYVRVDATTTINGGGEIDLYNGAMLRTVNLTANSILKGIGTTSLVKVSANTTINGGGQVINSLQYCDANGIETNYGTFGSGATQGCNLYIPTSACNPDGNGSAPIIDTDNDGVADASDCYPNDATKAYCNAVPTGTVAFEDQWPYTGDYDMNDVVVSYSYNVITNASNNVVRVEGTYVLRATGGSFNNGFAVQFPVNRTAVSGVSGATLEAGQTKAVLVLFTDMHNEISAWNTDHSKPSAATKTYTVSFNVTSAVSLSAFGLGAYNPFIWNGSAGFGRGYEVHLPGTVPTDLVNSALFTTGQDNSNIGTGDTYVSKNGRYPWALNIPASFDYPVEKADINTAYTKFATWVSSAGTQYSNWYTNTSGYRNAANIY